MAEPTEPPSPPSPPKGDGTPDAGNPGHATPPEVAPKPGRQSARKNAGDGEPPKRARRTAANKPAARTEKAGSRTSTAAAPQPVKPRAPAPRRAAARPRATGISVATVPTPQSMDTRATDRKAKSGGRWWKAIAGGIGAIAAGAALFSLRGSSRRKGAHQADGTDSSKSFEAGIADEGTVPE